MRSIDLDGTYLTTRTTSTFLVAARLLLPIGNFAINRARLIFALLILKSGTDAELTTILFLDSLKAVMFLHARATLLVTNRPFRPLTELTMNWTRNDLALFCLLLRAFTSFASVLVLLVLSTRPLSLTNITSYTAHGPASPGLPFAIDGARILIT
jgi:hypothetical protein